MSHCQLFVRVNVDINNDCLLILKVASFFNTFILYYYMLTNSYTHKQTRGKD